MADVSGMLPGRLNPKALTSSNLVHLRIVHRLELEVLRHSRRRSGSKDGQYVCQLLHDSSPYQAAGLPRARNCPNVSKLRLKEEVQCYQKAAVVNPIQP